MQVMNQPNEKQKNYSIQDKWGDALSAGYLVLPSALLVKQFELGLSDGELITLLNLLAAWRDVDTLPCLRPSTIAKRMDVDARTVQRHISSLVAKNYIAKKLDMETGVTYYNLYGIVLKLKVIASQIASLKPVEMSLTVN